MENCQQNIGNLIQKNNEEKNNEEIEERRCRPKPGIKEKQIYVKERGAS